MSAVTQDNSNVGKHPNVGKNPFLIGADPELFIFDKAAQQHVSAYGQLPGDKRNPFVVDKGAVQVDGLAFEFNIQPAADLETFIENITAVTGTMQRLVEAKSKSYELRITPTAVFPREYFDKLPMDAKKLGCDPDYDAYTGEENVPPETTESFRTGSGHLHVGWTDFKSAGDQDHFEACRVAARQLDYGLYTPSLLWDDDTKRRKLYGRIGSFRQKPYGVEWRPLSNSWVSDVELQAWVFKASKHSMGLMTNGAFLEKDSFLKSCVDEIRNGKTLPISTQLSYYNHLTDEYNYPQLPWWYTGDKEAPYNSGIYH